MTKVAQSNYYLEASLKYFSCWLTPMYYCKWIYEKPCGSSWNYTSTALILEIYLGEMETIHVQKYLEVALLWVSFKEEIV